MRRRGLLLTMTEPPRAMEEEFNAWYDTEHLPERLAIPGFRSARRWVADCAAGEGKYLATYELDCPRVLESPAYLAHVGEHFTPWTRRCLGKALVFRRWACEQVAPGDADAHPGAHALLLIAAETETGTALLEHSGALSARRFCRHVRQPAMRRALRALGPRHRPAHQARARLPLSALSRLLRSGCGGGCGGAGAAAATTRLRPPPFAS